MKIIGLTGGIGTGKSTVASILAEFGARIIDADKLGHEAIKPGAPGWYSLIETFGQGILTSSQEIDRRKLGQMVFGKPQELSRLNRILHPLILELVKRKIEENKIQGVGVTVLEAILLVEAGWRLMVEEIWVTVAPERVIIQRLKQRNNYSESESMIRIRSQSTFEERLKYADVVIATDCPLEQLRRKINYLWNLIDKD